MSAGKQKGTFEYCAEMQVALNSPPPPLSSKPLALVMVLASTQALVLTLNLAMVQAQLPA